MRVGLGFAMHRTPCGAVFDINLRGANMTAMRREVLSSLLTAVISRYALPLLLASVVPCSALQVANSRLTRNLSPGYLAALDSQGMVAYTTSDSEIFDIYRAASSDDEPIFVTTDLALHTYHVLFDFALRDAERTYFYPAIETMLRGLVAHQLRLCEAGSPDAVRAAARDNVAFLSVPLAILDANYEVPAFADDRARAERASIDAADVIKISPTLGFEEDYTQYKPRGHYTMSDRLRRYFKAMTFLGRMTFYLCPDGDSNAGVEPTRRALLLCDAFRESTDESAKSALTAWRRVYEPTAWMVGEADDLLPLDYLSLLDSLRAGTPVVEWVADRKNVLAFIHAARALPNPRILSIRLLYTEPLGTTKGMRLMGQRFLLDSYIFRELVFSKVGTWPDNPRLLPMGLDVMATLGSQRARHHLLSTYHEDRFENYVSQLDSVTARLARMTDEDWHSTAFLQWLYALRLNLEPVGTFGGGATVPLFVQSRAYEDKALMTACGSWAELHRDVILYSKEVYVEDGAMPPPPPKHQAYVEPKPRVFQQVAQMTDELKQYLSKMQVAGDATLEACDILARNSRTLAGIAQDELDGINPSEWDVRFCHAAGSNFGCLALILREDNESESSMSGKDKRPQPMPVISDVATDPNEGQVLEVAVGNPCKLYVLIPFYGKTYLAVGGCFSYYEFAKPADERMTDEEWRSLDPKPPMPKWTRSLVHE
jgi:hypothetical protein